MRLLLIVLFVLASSCQPTGEYRIDSERLQPEAKNARQKARSSLGRPNRAVDLSGWLVIFCERCKSFTACSTKTIVVNQSGWKSKLKHEVTHAILCELAILDHHEWMREHDLLYYWRDTCLSSR